MLDDEEVERALAPLSPFCSDRRSPDAGAVFREGDRPGVASRGGIFPRTSAIEVISRAIEAELRRAKEPEQVASAEAGVPASAAMVAPLQRAQTSPVVVAFAMIAVVLLASPVLSRWTHLGAPAPTGASLVEPPEAPAARVDPSAGAAVAPVEEAVAEPGYVEALEPAEAAPFSEPASLGGQRELLVAAPSPHAQPVPCVPPRPPRSPAREAARPAVAAPSVAVALVAPSLGAGPLTGPLLLPED